MKILIVGKVSTNPIRIGTSRLIIDQAIQLREMGNEVHYLYIHDVRRRENPDLIKPSYFKDMCDFWGKDSFHILKISKTLHLYYLAKQYIKFYLNNGYIHPDDTYTNAIHKEINKLDSLHKFDCCIVNYYHLSKALTKIQIPIKAILTHDIFTFRDKVCGCKVMASLTPNNEALAVQRADYILNVQEEDSIYFKKLAPNSSVLTVFSSFKYNPTEYIGNHNILFLSGANEFNFNGIEWFIKCIFPQIIERFPDAKLIIGGGISTMMGKYQANPNINIQGYVESVADFFNQGDLFINPTYQGTGLKIKTLEGVAFDKVVLAHTNSISGLYNENNIPIFAYAESQDWVNKITEIFVSKSVITNTKINNKAYIDGMNSFIRNQYEILLAKH